MTPKRIKYARTKEEELYTQLIDLASRKQSEIKELVHQAIADATDDIVTQVSRNSKYCPDNMESVLKCPKNVTCDMLTVQNSPSLLP